jgi:hypothetical protein
VSSARGDRAVFRTPSTTEPVTGVGDTRPMTSEPPPGLLAGPPTPSGFQALSSSGPVQASIPPAPGRNGALYGAAAIAILAVTGGGLYLATARAPKAPQANEPTESTESAARAGAVRGPASVAAARSDGAPSTSSEPSSSAAPVVPSTSQTARTTATRAPPTAPTAPVNTGAVGTAKKPPPITTVAPPASTAVLKPPPPTPPGPGTIAPPRNSPRPIDTQL